MRCLRSFALCLFLAVLAACGDPSSPEQQVRAVIEQMEAAAEARDTRGLMRHISESYRDAHGQSREEAARYARGYFIANQAIHLLTRIERLEFPSEAEARATVLVGMVGRDAHATATWDVVADLYEFDLSLLREDGEWKVLHAGWVRR